MKRTTTIVLAVLLAVSMMAMPLAAADAVGVQDDEQDTEDDGVAPGEQLAGVVGVQEAELEGDLSERTYGISIAKSATDDAKADVVETQLAEVEDRIADLENRSDELNDSYEAGEISQGQYGGKMAAIAAEKVTAERLANGTAATAGEFNETLLEERGIDVAAIEMLAENASEIGGPEVAEIAQSIAGERVGQPVAADREPGAPIDRPGAGAGPADDADTVDDTADADHWSLAKPQRSVDGGSELFLKDRSLLVDLLSVFDQPL